MQQVHQMLDMIWVRTADGRHYGETPENFALDMGKPCPALPEGIADRQYEPDVRHTLKIGTDVVDGGPMPWPEGDEILARADALHTNKQNREAAAKAVQDEKDKAALEALQASMPKPRVMSVADELDKVRESIELLRADVERLKAQLIK